MIAKKSLQKFTESEAKINRLLSLEKITPNDIAPLSKAEIDNLMGVLTTKFNALDGVERDIFFKKIEPITGEATKNELWESNHTKITKAISLLIQEYGRIPSKTEIADKTKLSRQTVHKHLNEYAEHPLYLEQFEQLRFMTSKVLAKVYQFAINGDTGAAKLYFNVMGLLNKGKAPSNTLIQNQNNYIQINGQVFSQDILNSLEPEQIQELEKIFKMALPRK